MKKALITGVTGQDGAYLTKLLLKEGYKVYGGYRKTSSTNFNRLDFFNLLQNKNLNLIELDLLDEVSLVSSILDIKPDEIYNLAGQSFVGTSFSQPVLTYKVNFLSVITILETLKRNDRNIRFFQASSSEIFDNSKLLLNENTRLEPRNPYGLSKMSSHLAVQNYRKNFGLFACSGIMFNHESPLRGKEFVVRKITNSIAEIKKGNIEYFELGNLNSGRDWGYAEDFVSGMHKILQHDLPEDFVLSTGVATSIRNIVEYSFKVIGVNIIWKGKGIDEVGIDQNSGKVRVRVNKDFFRPNDERIVVGDSSKAKEILGWSSNSNIKKLCRIMVEHDIY